MPFCAYCGSEVREQDKFCLSCGKPRLVKSTPDTKGESTKATPPPAAEPVRGTEKKSQKLEQKSEIEEKQIKKSQNSKETEGEKELAETGKQEPPASSSYEIPADIQEQIELRMELEILRLKKKKIANKIEEINKLLDDPNYELDMKFHDEVNTKIKAIRQVKADLDQEEEKLKGKLDPSFPLVSLPTKIKVMKDQIEELKTNLKFHKVEKEVFDQLHNEYLDKLKKDIKQHNDLIVGLKTWQTRLKAERVELEKEIKLARARFKSKEISKEKFDARLEELENQINKIEAKLKVINSFL